jgi:hypothetical protein
LIKSSYSGLILEFLTIDVYKLYPFIFNNMEITMEILDCFNINKIYTKIIYLFYTLCLMSCCKFSFIFNEGLHLSHKSGTEIIRGPVKTIILFFYISKGQITLKELKSKSNLIIMNFICTVKLVLCDLPKEHWNRLT